MSDCENRFSDTNIIYEKTENSTISDWGLKISIALIFIVTVICVVTLFLILVAKNYNMADNFKSTA